MNKKTIKICFVSLLAYSLFNKKSHSSFGGAEVQLFNIVNELSNRNNINIDFIVGHNSDKHATELFKKIKILKVVNLSKENILNKITSAFRLFYYLIKSNSNIYIQRSAGAETGLVALYCKLFHKKFIYMTAHEIDCNGEYRKKNRFLGLLYEFGLKNAHLVITQNNDHKKILKKNYNINATIISNGFDIPNKIYSNTRDYILWVARLENWKQPEIFLNLAKKFPKEKFIMIAPSLSDKHYSNKIRSIAEKMKNLQSIPSVPFSEINSYFAKAKIFINTSTFEGFPNTFVQATMYGTPIISLNVNPVNFLNKYNCGYCANGDIDKLHQFTQKLLTDNKTWKQMSSNARKYAKENHDIKKNIIKLINLINHFPHNQKTLK